MVHDAWVLVPLKKINSPSPTRCSETLQQQSKQTKNKGAGFNTQRESYNKHQGGVRGAVVVSIACGASTAPDTGGKDQSIGAIVYYTGAREGRGRLTSGPSLLPVAQYIVGQAVKHVVLVGCGCYYLATLLLLLLHSER